MYLINQMFHFPVAKRHFALRGILAFRATNEAVFAFLTTVTP